MALMSFVDIEARVREDIEDLGALLPACRSAEELRALSDAEYLSTMSRRIFRAGLRAAMVDAKWPDFEQAFYHFRPLPCSMMSDDDIDVRMHNPKLIRHLKKIQSIRHNAAMIVELAAEHGSFANFIAAWPAQDVVGLWALLKQRGAQLGGNSGPYFLRMMGKDTFLLTNDVVGFLLARGIVTKKPTSGRDLATVQAAFNQWQQQSGWPLSHISRLLSLYPLH